MRILIIQTSRIGDLAQTLPLAHALARNYPEAEILLACREGVHALLHEARLPVEVLPLPAPLLTALGQITSPDLPPAEDFLASMPRLLALFSIVINVTHDYESAVLTSLVAAEKRWGRLHAPAGEVRAAGTASRYLWAMVRHRTENLFNLSDLQMLMAGLRPQPGAVSLPLAEGADLRARTRLQTEGWDGLRPLIGLQLGASDFHRAWDAAGFARAAEQIAAVLPVEFVLFGDARERERVDFFQAQFPNRIIDLVGKTRLEELPALLAHCALVIGNDTGTLHVAAAVGTRTLGIFFATAFFTETAPYGPDHAVLQTELICSPCNASSRCPEQKCRVVLTSEAVAETALWLLKNASVPPTLPDSLHLYRSAFVESGLLLYAPVGSASSAFRKALASRIAWSAALAIVPSLSESEMFRLGDAPVHDEAYGAVASWAQDGVLAAREMIDCLQSPHPAPLRIAVLRRRLEEIPACLTETATGLLQDFCRMSFMDFDAAGSPGFFQQIAQCFEEIFKVSSALEAFSSSIP